MLETDVLLAGDSRGVVFTVKLRINENITHYTLF